MDVTVRARRRRSPGPDDGRGRTGRSVAPPSRGGAADRAKDARPAGAPTDEGADPAGRRRGVRRSRLRRRQPRRHRRRRRRHAPARSTATSAASPSCCSTSCLDARGHRPAAPGRSRRHAGGPARVDGVAARAGPDPAAGADRRDQPRRRPRPARCGRCCSPTATQYARCSPRSIDALAARRARARPTAGRPSSPSCSSPQASGLCISGALRPEVIAATPPSAPSSTDSSPRCSASRRRSTMTTTTTRTFCRFCHAACPIEVDVDDGPPTVVGVRGDAADPLFGGYTCIKGRHLGDQHHHPDRLRTALCDAAPTAGSTRSRPARRSTRSPSGWRRSSPTATPRAVASYCGTATFQNAAAHPVARAFHQAIGSPSFYTSITIDQPAKMVTPLRLGAVGRRTAAVVDGRRRRSSSASTSSSRCSASRAGRRSSTRWPRCGRRSGAGLQLIVIDPRRTETAAMADIHLQVDPGRGPDAARRDAAGHPRRRTSADAEFCDRWVDGLDELHRALRAVRPRPRRSGAAACPADDVVRAARMFAAGPPGFGDVRHRSEHGAARHVDGAPRRRRFNVVCGRFPRAGEQVQNTTGVLGLTGPPSRRRKAQVERAAAGAARRRGPAARVRGLHTILGQAPTAALADEILEPGPGRVRALLTVGGNPVLAWPDQVKVVRALEALDLHVALDIRVSATARLADYVIPSQLSLERPTCRPTSTAGSRTPTSCTRRPCWSRTRRWSTRPGSTSSWPGGSASRSSCRAATLRTRRPRHAPTSCWS